jgi:hypothetical protein
LGAVYEIPTEEKAALDQAEGLGFGYDEQSLDALAPDEQRLQVQTYIANSTAIDDNLRPYSWYKDFVLKGAEEHGLPLAYIEGQIRSVGAVVDPDQKRERARRAEVKR